MHEINNQLPRIPVNPRYYHRERTDKPRRARARQNWLHWPMCHKQKQSLLCFSLPLPPPPARRNCPDPRQSQDAISPHGERLRKSHRLPFIGSSSFRFCGFKPLFKGFRNPVLGRAGWSLCIISYRYFITGELDSGVGSQPGLTIGRY